MRKIRRIIPFLAAVLVLGACDDAADGGPDRGRLTIQLTDAPGDLKEAFVKIDRFILIRSEQDTSASGRIELTPDNTGFIELIVLAGGKLLNVVDQAVVPVGTFSELRVVIDEAYVRLKDGRVFATPGADLPAGVVAAGELKCPSCAQSGFKVKFAGAGLLVNNESIVVLDFDAGQSFIHEAGNSGKWIMHPVLHATSRNIPLGRIRGTVTLATGVTLPACGGLTTNRSVFRPRAVMGADSILGVTDTLGFFRIANLVPGTYALNHVTDITYTNGDSLTIAATATPPSVVVPPGDSATAAYLISAATCH